MRWLEELPGWVRASLIFGGGLLSAFSGKLWDPVQDAGLWFGIILLSVGLFATLLHFIKKWRRARTMGAPDLIIAGLVVLILGAGIVIGGVFWHARVPAVAAATASEAAPIMPVAGTTIYAKYASFQWDFHLPLAISITPAATLSRLRIFVDVVVTSMGVRLGSAEHQRLPIGEIADVVKDQQVTVNLVGRRQDGTLFWEGSNGGQEVFPLTVARVVILGPTGDEQYVYFMLTYSRNHKDEVTVLDQSQMDILSLWLAGKD